MREKAIALVLATILALGLSACDGSMKKPANNNTTDDKRPGTQQGTTNSGSNGSTNNGTANNSNNSNSNSNSSTNGGTNTTPAPATQQTAAWRQMLQNGLDGLLLSGENTHWE